MGHDKFLNINTQCSEMPFPSEDVSNLTGSELTNQRDSSGNFWHTVA